MSLFDDWLLLPLHPSHRRFFSRRCLNQHPCRLQLLHRSVMPWSLYRDLDHPCTRQGYLDSTITESTHNLRNEPTLFLSPLWHMMPHCCFSTLSWVTGILVRHLMYSLMIQNGFDYNLNCINSPLLPPDTPHPDTHTHHQISWLHQMNESSPASYKFGAI